MRTGAEVENGRRHRIGHYAENHFPETHVLGLRRRFRTTPATRNSGMLRDPTRRRQDVARSNGAQYRGGMRPTPGRDLERSRRCGRAPRPPRPAGPMALEKRRLIRSPADQGASDHRCLAIVPKAFAPLFGGLALCSRINASSCTFGSVVVEHRLAAAPSDRACLASRFGYLVLTPRRPRSLRLRAAQLPEALALPSKSLPSR